MTQRLMCEIAYGNRRISRHKKSKKIHLSKSKLERFVIWFLCLIGSLIFVVVPYVTFQFKNDLKFVDIMRDQGIPLLTFSVYLANLIEIIITDRKSKLVQITHLFFLILSIICYFAYFITYHTNKLGFLTSHAITVSSILLIACFVGEMLFILIDGDGY